MALDEQAARLGGDEYTCFGAVRAGSHSGIPAFAGKYVGKWPDMNEDAAYQPGPYAKEEPLFVVTAQNMDKYLLNLTEGARALLKQLPSQFKMRVYPSHRDFGYPDWTCEVARHNAKAALLTGEGNGVENGLGGATAFPFAATGIEAIWGAKTTYRAWTTQGIFDIAAVYSDGKAAWGRNQLMTLSPMHEPGLDKRPSLNDEPGAYFYNKYLSPERNKGEVSVGTQPNNFEKQSTNAWQYLPGTRRLRQAPEVGYDYPVPPFGLHTSDEDSGFNGATDRYDWKLLGLKEFLVPYHNFRVNDPSLSLKDLVTPGTLNPEYIRYELHRVQVVEATLKEGFRHQYARRRVYIDDESRQILWAEHDDSRGELWRVAMFLTFYSPEAMTFQRGVQVFHDLRANAYEANYLVNESGKNGWVLNQPIKMSQFSPQAAARGGR